MTTNALACANPKCGSELPAALAGAPGFAPCPVCGLAQHLELFPARSRALPPADPGEPIVAAGEASCFFHEGKRAAVSCEACGVFLCRLCDLPLDGRRLCPRCVETEMTKPTSERLVTRRFRYDYTALALVTYGFFLFFYPTLITAPIALFLGVRYWNAPRSLVRRGRGLLVLAMALAVLEILLWGVAIVGIVWGLSRMGHR